MEKKIRKLVARVNLLKEENSTLAARIQKLETASKQEPASFSITEACVMAELLGPLNKETSIKWMLQAANSLPSATGFHLTQIARLCMSPTHRDMLEAAVMIRNLLSKDMYVWMDEILTILWPKEGTQYLYHIQKQNTNEDPEAYIARKKLLAKVVLSPEEMERKFESDLIEGFHPKSKELLDSLTQYGGPNSLAPNLWVLSQWFRTNIAKRQEKALAQKRENKKKSRESAPREHFSGTPKCPTQPVPAHQREMETTESTNPPSEQPREAPRRIHSPHSQGTGTSSCPANFRQANLNCPHQKENIPLHYKNTSAAVRTTVHKQKGHGHAPYGSPGTKKVKTSSESRTWIQSQNPKTWKPFQPSMPEKGTPRGHSSHPRGPNWNGTGRCVPPRRHKPSPLEETAEMGDTASVSAQSLDREVSNIVSASAPPSPTTWQGTKAPETSYRKGILETAL